MAQQQSFLGSVRKQCTAYTRLYNRWLLTTVLLLSLDDCFRLADSTDNDYLGKDDCFYFPVAMTDFHANSTERISCC